MNASVLTLSSHMFKRAIWKMRYDALPLGTTITCEVDFTLRPLYFFLVVPLVLTPRKALARDLACLKAAIESAGP